MKEGIDEGIVIDMIRKIGDNPDRAGLKDTPTRVTRMWKEIFKGYNPDLKPKVTIFDNGADGIVYDEKITDNGPFYSYCEHHMIPFFGKYWFAYIPHPKGKILGLSKVARVVDYYSARLQIQERLGEQIIGELWDALMIPAQEKDGFFVIEDRSPLAMGLFMDAEHLCKTMRGVKKQGKMTTTKLLGGFKTDPLARKEFFDWVNKNGT